MTHYRRILLKLSGEALRAADPLAPIGKEQLAHYIAELRSAYKEGVEVAVVIGGGNFWRGRQASLLAIEGDEKDYMGMMGTFINVLALRAQLRVEGIPTTLMSPLSMPALFQPYDSQQAICALQEKKIVLLGGGLGVPGFSTDTAATTFAADLKADIVLKATKVEGVYAEDPMKNPQAKRYKELSFDEILEQRLEVIDREAVLRAQRAELPLIIYHGLKKGHLAAILKGEPVGTWVGSIKKG